MYQKPDHFTAEELFPPEVVHEHTKQSGLDPKIWRLMDNRVLWTLDQLRKRFRTTVVNDYKWGGTNKYRGFRPIEAILDVDWLRETGKFRAKFSSFFSQHCFGRAVDCKFKYVTAEDVRQDILKNPGAECYKYITAVEDLVSWFHFDVRNWNRTRSGILFFYA